MLAGLPTSFADEREQIVYEMAIALSNTRWVPKGLYDRAVKALGHVGITDVITLMGYYRGSSRSVTITFAPSRASVAAQAAPIPDAPPVTMATLSWTWPMTSSVVVVLYIVPTTLTV